PDDRTDSAEVSTPAPRDGRAATEAMGGRRGTRIGLGWRLARGPRHRPVSADDHRRHAGVGATGRATRRRGGTRPASWRGAAREGGSHPDRNAQFEYINASVGRFLLRGEPAISVDTKKKELVGDFKNGGREWHARGEPEEVRVHDFLDKALGKAIPYGVYDMI